MAKMATRPSTYPFHHHHSFFPVHFGVNLGHSGRTVAEDDASDVQPELLPEHRRCIVAELVGVPVWDARLLAAVADRVIVGAWVVDFAGGSLGVGFSAPGTLRRRYWSFPRGTPLRPPFLRRLTGAKQGGGRVVPEPGAENFQGIAWGWQIVRFFPWSVAPL